MEPERREAVSTAEILLDSFRNKTKLAIISLLLMNGKMTVTQMSKFLHTTRSNLYQAVKELRRQEIIILSDSKIIKNYVEKYYVLNNELFDRIKYGDLSKAIGKLDASSIRELFISYLISSSILLSSIAEDIRNADDEMIMGYREILEKELIISLSTIPQKSMRRFSYAFHRLMRDVEEGNLDSTKERETEDILLMVFSFPLKRL